MPVNARQYRETVYRLRSHPGAREVGDFRDQRDSLLAVYTSLVPFLVLEYLSEASMGMLPSGIVFPLGYLLFWAFYYTYYKPGFLEEKLTASKKGGDLSGLPAVFLGVLIWFVKVTFVELTHFLFTRWVIEKPSLKMRAAGDSRSYHAHYQQARPQHQAHQHKHHQHQQYQRHQSQGPHTSHTHNGKTQPPPKSLPHDLQQALVLLGIPDARDWKEIHRRYRELAKKFHPDLNPDITSMGQRFMQYDAAYKKLQAVKAQYFPEKQ